MQRPEDELADGATAVGSNATARRLRRAVLVGPLAASSRIARAAVQMLRCRASARVLFALLCLELIDSLCADPKYRDLYAEVVHGVGA